MLNDSWNTTTALHDGDLTLRLLQTQYDRLAAALVDQARDLPSGIPDRRYKLNDMSLRSRIIIEGQEKPIGCFRTSGTRVSCKIQMDELDNWSSSIRFTVKACVDQKGPTEEHAEETVLHKKWVFRLNVASDCQADPEIHQYPTAFSTQIRSGYPSTTSRLSLFPFELLLQVSMEVNGQAIHLYPREDFVVYRSALRLYRTFYLLSNRLPSIHGHIVDSRNYKSETILITSVCRRMYYGVYHKVYYCITFIFTKLTPFYIFVNGG